MTTRYFYNDKGQLKRVSQPGQADTVFEYDDLGNQIRTGLDTNSTETLDGNDRITESETFFEKTGDDWWRKTVRRVYAKDSDDTTTDVSVRKALLTGLGSDGQVSESVAEDIHGNETVAKTFMNRAAKSRTQRTDYPDSSNDAVSVSVNGLLVSSLSKTGVETTYNYDALGRRTGTVDPRTGETVTHYNDRGEADFIEDPKGNRIQYTYDPVTGRKDTYANAMSKTTRYMHNDRGQTTHTWGEAAEPVKFVYDSYGRMAEMHTFRGGSGWDGEEWPADTGEADITRWHYDEVSGLLLFKEYDDGKGVTYTYTDSGKIETRTWARKNGAEPLVTTYIYDPVTGDLRDIDYSDSTQDIGFTYDRMGRQKTVTDAAGTRIFSYNDSRLMLETETITGIYDRVITRTYDTEYVPGRSTGFNIGTDYSVTYGYEPDTGRFGSVSWNSSETASYTYEPNSDLLHSLTVGTEFKTTYQYEPERNLKTQIKNEFGSQTVSQYDYEYNEQGLRTSLVTDGSAFSGVMPGPDAQVADYMTNSLNQYTDITTTVNSDQQVTDSPKYDDDGNLTEISDYPGSLKYSYNAENRLVSAAPELPLQGDIKVEFVYDYMGDG
ncbi:MAG: hypothetical protein GY749_07805 [Desulfobacteraceae bacterium]|nr:hypothetical protein [Desulfobacteraceae bacterium]